MLRRTIGITAAAAAISIAAIVPASAEAPLATYQAASDGSALELTLGGETLAVSQTQSAVSSSPAPAAAADGAALLLAGSAAPGAAPSASPGTQETNSQCPIQADLDALTQGALSGLQLEVACLNTATSITAGAPAAQSGSGEVTIRVLGPGGDLVAPILGEVLAGATQVTDPVVEALSPLLGAISDVSQIDIPSVLDQLTTAIADDTFVLAEIVVAPSLARSSADAANGVVAEAGSNGVTIKILPGIATALDQLVGLIDIPNPSAGPLLEIKLGTSTAKVVIDPATGNAVPDASAAQLLSITADDDLGIIGTITGQLADTVNSLAVTQLSCDGGLLADLVCVDLGSVNELDHDELVARGLDFGAGTVGREASAASVQVLPVAADALGGSVLGISLARATAAATAAAPLPGGGGCTVNCDGPVDKTPRGPLPSTGSESTAALMLTLGMLAVGSAGAVVLRRSRSVA
jgi:LPXTG-motif cell wall-anchored protein